MVNSLDLLEKNNERLRLIYSNKIKQAQEALKRIDELEDQAIELIFPDNWVLADRNNVFVAFKINDQLVSFSVEPVYISFETTQLFINDKLEDEIQRNHDFSGAGLQKLIDYFIPILKEHHNDLDYTFS